MSNHTALKLGILALRGYVGLPYDYTLHLLPNTELGAAKDHGEN